MKKLVFIICLVLTLLIIIHCSPIIFVDRQAYDGTLYAVPITNILPDTADNDFYIMDVDYYYLGNGNWWRYEIKVANGLDCDIKSFRISIVFQNSYGDVYYRMDKYSSGTLLSHVCETRSWDTYGYRWDDSVNCLVTIEEYVLEDGTVIEVPNEDRIWIKDERLTEDDF